MSTFPKIQLGTSKITGDGAASVVEKSIAFGSAFASEPKVFVCWMDDQTTPSAVSYVFVKSGSASTTGFVAMTKFLVSNTGNWYFNWIAIGT